MMGEYTPFMKYSSRPATASPPIITLKRTHDQNVGVTCSSRQRGGILRHRMPVAVTPTSSALYEQELKSLNTGADKTAELLARLMASIGVPFECVNETDFREFIQYVKPNFYPTPKVLEGIANRLGPPGKQKSVFAKSTGALSVTFDIASNADDKYLVFSIHYFEDGLFTRQHVVYLRRLILSDPDGMSILTCLRRAVNNYNYANVIFTNVLCPNEELASALGKQYAVKRKFLCFYDYVTRFVTRIMEIEQFQVGFEILRNFVNFIRNDTNYYCKYRRMQLTKNEELDLPSIGDDTWPSKFSFLTRCLTLHISFDNFATRCQLPEYLTPNTYNILVFFQKIIQQCAKWCRMLSGPLNSISQVIPAIMGLRTYISTNTRKYLFEAEIKETFTTVFQSITDDDSKSTRYEIATLLDPRSAHSVFVYGYSTWKNIERKVISEFSNMTTFSSERPFSSCFTMMSLEEKASVISLELEEYRKACMAERPAANSDPFSWWGNRQRNFDYLSVLAQEYLACPAITIDASYYFGENGKMNRLCKTYNYETLENTLNFAGFSQKFRGRGDFQDRNFPSRMGDLEVLLSSDTLNYMTLVEPPLPKALWKPPGLPSHVKIVQLPEETSVNPIVTKSMDLDREIKEETTDEVEKPKEGIQKEPPRKIVRVAEPRPQPRVIGVFHVPNKYLNCSPLQRSNLTCTTLPRKYVVVNPVMGLTEPPNKTSSDPVMKPVEEIKEEFEDSKAYAKYMAQAKEKLYEKSKIYVQGLENAVDTRRVMNRRCVLCGHLEPSAKLKNVTIDMERLICLFGTIYRKKMTISEAQTCFFRSAKSYYCRVHFTQTSDDIYTILGVENSYFVLHSLNEKVQKIGDLLSQIRGRSMSLSETREHLTNFTSKYCSSPCDLKPRPTLHLFDDYLFEEDEPTDESTLIVPKNEREPRKQILEDLNQSDTTILQIEEEPFKLPDTPLDDEVLGDSSEICCFCLSRKNKSSMLRVPATEDRVARWVSKLGPEFAERLKPGKNFVCRSHFGQSSFSSRGRLLKGMLPDVDSERVKVVYKIDGGNILKLHESKVGTDREPKVDLTEGYSNETAEFISISPKFP